MKAYIAGQGVTKLVVLVISTLYGFITAGPGASNQPAEVDLGVGGGRVLRLSTTRETIMNMRENFK